MRTATPALPSSAGGPTSSSGRPKIFGGGTRHSARIEKRSARESALENQHTKKLSKEKDLGPTEAEPEENAQPQLARPDPRGPAGRDRRSSRNTTRLATNRDAFVDADEDESRKTAPYRSISEGGPRLKNIAELLAETDLHQNFKIPSDNIIANEDVDRRVHQQMRRLAPSGDLRADRVRMNLVDSVKYFESQWDLRSGGKSRPFFWKSVCMKCPWMSQLDGVDCREFFLWLVVYFRHGSGRKGTTRLIKAFERLDRLFAQEQDCELNELDGIDLRVRPPANQGRSREPTAIRRGAASKKGSKAMPEDGNIFRLSGNTNMTDYELCGVDVQGLTPIVDVGDRRRKDEDRKRVFEEEMEADRARIAEEAAEKAAKERAAAMEAAAAPKPQPRTQVRGRSSRKRSTPFEEGRKPSGFEEDMDQDDGEEKEEEKLRAAALKRQKLLERHAARGGPTSD